MQRTTYKVGLSPDELNMFPLSYEKHLSTLEEVYDHCVFIAQELKAHMPINRKGLLEGIAEQDETGATFVTLDFDEPEITKAVVIIFERGTRKSKRRSKKKVDSA